MTLNAPNDWVRPGLFSVGFERIEQSARAHIDMMLNDGPALMLRLTPFGAIRWMNRAAQRFMGVDADDLVGQLWWAVCESEQSHDALLGLLALLPERDVQSYELPLLSEGQVWRTRWDFVRVFDREGALDELIGCGVVLPTPG